MSRLSLLKSEHVKEGETIRHLEHNLLVQAGEINILSDESDMIVKRFLNKLENAGWLCGFSNRDSANRTEYTFLYRKYNQVFSKVMNEKVF